MKIPNKQKAHYKLVTIDTNTLAYMILIANVLIYTHVHTIHT